MRLKDDEPNYVIFCSDMAQSMFFPRPDLMVIVAYVRWFCSGFSEAVLNRIEQNIIYYQFWAIAGIQSMWKNCPD